MAFVKTKQSENLSEGEDDPRFPIYPQRLVKEVRNAMPDDGLICLDNGVYKIWFARNYPAYLPNTVLLDNALATMGAGPAIGYGSEPGPSRQKNYGDLR